jgi:hypothetical protein
MKLKNIDDKRILTSWLNLYPYIKTITNVFSGDYSNTNNPELLSRFFNCGMVL